MPLRKNEKLQKYWNEQVIIFGMKLHKLLKGFGNSYLSKAGQNQMPVLNRGF